MQQQHGAVHGPAADAAAGPLQMEAFKAWTVRAITNIEDTLVQQGMMKARGGTTGVTAGAARVVGTEQADIASAANALLDDPATYAAMANVENPYGDGHAADRIAALCGAFVDA